MPCLGNSLSLASQRRRSSVAASAPPWSPSDLTELLGWLDGADNATKHVDGGGLLTQFDDKSTNGLNGVPLGGFPSPLLELDVLRGYSLFKLINTTVFKTVKTPLGFPEGDGYAGPLFEVFAMRVKMPTGSDSNRFLSVSGHSFIIGSDASGGAGRRLTGMPGNSDIGELNMFTSQGACRPMAAALDSYGVMILVNAFGTNGKAKLFFYAPAEGDVPSYFAAIDRVPYTHELWTGDTTGFFFGYGSADAVLHLAEYVVATDEPDTIEFDAACLSLVNKWIGTLRPLLMLSGDSLTFGGSLLNTQSYPYKVGQALAGIDCVNVGLGSETLTGAIDKQPGMARLHRINSSNRIVIWLGTNDINGNFITNAQDLVDTIAALSQMWIASGFETYIIDVIPRGTNTPTQETMRASVNSKLAAQWSGFATGFISVASTAAFSSPTAYNNATYYDADTIHLTEAGYAVVASAVSSVFSE